MRPRSDQAARAARALRLVLAFALTLASGAARGGAPTGVVCLALGPTTEGLSSEALSAALHLEARKVGIALAIAPGEAACISSAAAVVVRVGADGVARVLPTGGAVEVVPLAGVAVPDRATELARAATAALQARFEARRAEPLLDPDAPVVLPFAAAPSPARRPALGVGGLLTVGGGYAYGFGADTHRGVLDGELALTLFDGVLAGGVTGGLSPSQTVAHGEPTTTTRQAELIGVVRGGLALGPVLLRLGVGGGWQWRHVELRSALRFQTVERESGAAALAIELDALVRLERHLVLSVALPGRVWFGGDDFTWNGRTAYEAPRGAVGLSARLGLAF